MKVNGCDICPGADLSGADLSGVSLSGADLSGADLSGADLSGADLSRSYLIGANLSGAYLISANLSIANLSEANLREANLREANLIRANLSGANLQKATYPTGSLDPRPYSLHVAFNPSGLGFISGCNNFDCLEGAVAHWGADNYHTPRTGRSYVAQCTMLDTLYKAGDLPLCQPWNEE